MSSEDHKTLATDQRERERESGPEVFARFPLQHQSKVGLVFVGQAPRDKLACNSSSSTNNDRLGVSLIFLFLVVMLSLLLMRFQLGLGLTDIAADLADPR